MDSLFPFGIVTGRTSSLLGASSADLLNALKTLANIEDEAKLIAPEIIEPVIEKTEPETKVEEPTDVETELVGTLLPEIKQKTTYFEFEDPSIMEYAKIGSPSAIKTVLSKIKNPVEKYTEEEAVLLAVLHTVMTNVWVSEPVSFSVP